MLTWKMCFCNKFEIQKYFKNLFLMKNFEHDHFNLIINFNLPKNYYYFWLNDSLKYNDRKTERLNRRVKKTLIPTSPKDPPVFKSYYQIKERNKCINNVVIKDIYFYLRPTHANNYYFVLFLR